MIDTLSGVWQSGAKPLSSRSLAFGEVERPNKTTVKSEDTGHGTAGQANTSRAVQPPAELRGGDMTGFARAVKRGGFAAPVIASGRSYATPAP